VAKCKKCGRHTCRNGSSCWYRANGGCDFCHCADESENDTEDDGDDEYYDDFECPGDRPLAECGYEQGKTTHDEHGNITCSVCDMQVGYDSDLDRWFGVDGEQDEPFEAPHRQGLGFD
jgi:hypothetical protein